MSLGISTLSLLKKPGIPHGLWGSLILIMSGTIFFIDLMVPLGVAGGVLYIAPILVASFVLQERSQLLLAITCSGLTIMGWMSSPITELPDWKVTANRIVALLVIWATTTLMIHRNRLSAKQESALQRIRVLEGILPICVECKKIRDDSHNWHQLERYITDNSEAMFTHGYCPDCKTRTLQRIEQEFQYMKNPQ